jgi:ectoine hydroxylase-related dioxygenase (phytanoyl-CoA dioxygenase family)
MVPAAASSQVIRDSFERDGFVVVRGVLPRADVMALRARAETLVQEAASGSSPYMQVAFDATGAVKLVKASGLVERDAQFHDIATRDALVDVVETLIGAGSRRFRDVLIVKPARTAGIFSYHQDSAYWDVEPKALVSCWIGLGDVPAEASCLAVVPATHTRYLEHGLYLRGRYKVPQPITRLLRRLVSISGTGDNPEGTGGNTRAWRAKRWILADTTRYVPMLYDLQDFRIPVEAVNARHEALLPVEAGDVIFFHSLLWHASGPNRTDSTRFAEIVSFMGPDAVFVGRGPGRFPLARRQTSRPSRALRI